MDFDDLLLHPLRAVPRASRTGSRRGSDGSRSSWSTSSRTPTRRSTELVRALGGARQRCVVGDDDQSIYGWRGADVRNMLDSSDDFPGTRLVRLEENYRSTQVVLDAANAVIAENTGRIGKTLRTRRPGGEPVTLLAAADERDEAEWIVRELGARSAGGRLGLRRHGGALSHQRPVPRAEEAFRRAGVPYRLVGAISFYDRREVKDLLAYLRLVANPARRRGVPPRGRGAAARPRRDQPRHARGGGRAAGASRCSTAPASPTGCPSSGPTCAMRSAASRR